MDDLDEIKANLKPKSYEAFGRTYNTLKYIIIVLISLQILYFIVSFDEGGVIFIYLVITNIIFLISLLVVINDLDDKTSYNYNKHWELRNSVLKLLEFIEKTNKQKK